MTRLIIYNQPLGRQEKSKFTLSANVDQLNTDPEEMFSDIPPDIKKLNITTLLSRSKYDEFLTSKECLIMLNVLTYPEDFIVKRDSVKAVRNLTKEQYNTLWALFSGDTYTEIARKQFKSTHTIKRHSQDLRHPLGLNNRCESMVAFLRYLLEFWQDEN